MKYLKNVTSVKLDLEKCTSCKKCIDVCPREVIDSSEDNEVYLVEKDNCIECGACQRNCPFEAITVKSGVGCAAAYLYAAINGGEPCCDGGSGSSCC